MTTGFEVTDELLTLLGRMVYQESLVAGRSPFGVITVTGSIYLAVTREESETVTKLQHRDGGLKPYQTNHGIRAEVVIREGKFHLSMDRVGLPFLTSPVTDVITPTFLGSGVYHHQIETRIIQL